MNFPLVAVPCLPLDSYETVKSVKVNITDYFLDVYGSNERPWSSSPPLVIIDDEKNDDLEVLMDEGN